MKKKVHFIGICGSGAAAVALLAAKNGYEVTGCDVNISNYYCKELMKNGIKIFNSHDKRHIDNVDIVAITPAILDIAPNEEELVVARKRGILMTWQEFMGRYLQKEKKVIAIAGTHGKTTTTFMVGEVLEACSKDPTVLGGSIYKSWGAGSRVGQSSIFVCEADEFNRNFLNYHPSIAVVNNIEMDHPECFKDIDDILDAYEKFILNLINDKILIINGDSYGTRQLLCNMQEKLISNHIKVILIHRQETVLSSSYNADEVVSYKIVEKNNELTKFEVHIDNETKYFELSIPGEYNVANAISTICISKLIEIPYEMIRRKLFLFEGVERRFDFVGEFNNIPVYDDFAHHPTEIKSLLNMCREYYAQKKVVAIFEPHQVSRLRLFLKQYVEALELAHKVIITKTYLGREVNKNVAQISAKEWCEASADGKIIYEEQIEKVKEIVDELIQCGECDMILVVGAANSFKISRFLCKEE